MSIIFMDTETTGLVQQEGNPMELQPYAIELFALKTDKKGRETDRWHSYFKPPIPLPEIITKITGIEEYQLRDKPIFSQKANSLAKFFLGAKTLVCHNLEFDKAILRFELERAGKLFNFPWPAKHFCTVEQSMHIKGHRLKLSELHKLATGEEEIKKAHSADADVFAMVAAWKWLKKEAKNVAK